MHRFYKKLACLLLALLLLLTGGCSPSEKELLPSETEMLLPEERPQALFLPYDEKGELLRSGRDADGNYGMVSSANAYATKAGLDVLKAGGNAIDAAVAVAFAIGTVESYYSGLGGGGFMLIHFGETGENTCIDFRERAPMDAGPELWPRTKNGDFASDYQMIGGPSIAVPGQVKGLLYALEKYGTLDRKTVIAPSIRLAEEGFLVAPFMVERLTDAYSLYTYTPETARIYMKDGLPYSVGDLYKNPDLGKTLRAISEKGEAGFYAGEVAEAIVSEARAYGSPMTLEDLEDYSVEEKPCLTGTYRGYTVVVPPLPAGGTAVLECLNILENFDVGSLEANSPDYIHMLSECFKLVFADRKAYMGDEGESEALLSKAYAKVQAERIDLQAASAYSEGDPYATNSGNTTHFSVADRFGNIVSVTQTNNGGSGITAPGTGVLLNNEMADFDPGEEGQNSIRGGKKPRSSMCPTLVLKEGEAFLSLGSPGSTRIITTVVQVLSHILDHHMDIQEAIDAPRFYDAAGTLSLEGRIPESTRAALMDMGHALEVRRDYDSYFGGVHGILRASKDSLRGGADPRRDGKAMGY
ncbi:MAG: gamma-glutamyltransferase [Clostridiales bacterium]|nr:gamma-glutamyltransferase [Clostridiales bacterium]